MLHITLTNRGWWLIDPNSVPDTFVNVGGNFYPNHTGILLTHDNALLRCSYAERGEKIINTPNIATDDYARLYKLADAIVDKPVAHQARVPAYSVLVREIKNTMKGGE